MAQSLLGSISSNGATVDAARFQKLLADSVTAGLTAKTKIKDPVDHPLDPHSTTTNKVHSWLRLGPLDTAKIFAQAALHRLQCRASDPLPSQSRANCLGFTDGRPGQTFQLAHGNILSGTLELGILESADPDATPGDMDTDRQSGWGQS